MLRAGACKGVFFRAAIKGGHFQIQGDLIKLMTELATSNENAPKLAEKNIPLINSEDLDFVERNVLEIEKNGEVFKGWTLAGENKLDANLNLARTICRRAEREIARLNEEEPLPRKIIPAYINRLSDLIYLWGVLAAKNILK